MPTVRNIDIDHVQEVYKRLRKFVRQLRATFPVKEVYLYGSFANREVHEGSDIDLVIVGDFKGRIFERIKEITSLTDLPIEPLVYTPQEFKEMKRSNPFLKNILRLSKKL